jgi:hypothetical protein
VVKLSRRRRFCSPLSWFVAVTVVCATSKYFF